MVAEAVIVAATAEALAALECIRDLIILSCSICYELSIDFQHDRGENVVDEVKMNPNWNASCRTVLV